MKSSEGGRIRLRGSVLGALLGAAFYFVIAIGILCLIVGPDHWSGRVMSSPINLFSFTAFGAAIGLLIERRRFVSTQQSAFDLDLLGDDEDVPLLPDDALEYRKQLRHLDEEQRSLVLVRLLNAGLQRARANWSAEDVGTAIKTKAEIQRDETDAEYSLVRYLAWAIPSIGFVGTVLGIGQAMGSIKPAAIEPSNNPDAVAAEVEKMDPLTQAAGYLNTAFDTTFVALVLSLILMYLLHRVQASEDSFMAKATDWCLQRLPFRMHIPKDMQP